MRSMLWFMVVIPVYLLAESAQITTIKKRLQQISTIKISDESTDDLYDPFGEVKREAKPITQQISAQKIPTLGGIINHQAFLNGRWVKAGDRVGNYKVLSVGGKSVRVSNGRKVYVISLSKKTIFHHKGKKSIRAKVLQ